MSTNISGKSILGFVTLKAFEVAKKKKLSRIYIIVLRPH